MSSAIITFLIYLQLLHQTKKTSSHRFLDKTSRFYLRGRTFNPLQYKKWHKFQSFAYCPKSGESVVIKTVRIFRNNEKFTFFEWEFVGENSIHMEFIEQLESFNCFFFGNSLSGHNFFNKSQNKNYKHLIIFSLKILLLFLFQFFTSESWFRYEQYKFLIANRMQKFIFFGYK